MNLSEKISRLVSRLKSWLDYCQYGVWRDTRTGWKVSVVKTLSLSLRSFMSSDLQTRACALTFRTLLAVVPALALLFAIGRGFGFQNLLTDQLYKVFPSQHRALETALKFVDSYLAQASEGIFVGVGIVFLLWTMISLLGNVENSFNDIFRVRNGRSLWRKITDYLAILLTLPVLMICAGGISLLMSTTLKSLLPFEFMKPAFTFLIDAVGYIFTWLFFAGAYMLIPNARVKFANALLAGIVVGTAFQILQWIFLTGQMYVAKYNAIYGGFSFLPLLLIWLQLAWLITLIGALLCYASQNIGQFSFRDDIENISHNYLREVEITIMAIVVKRFEQAAPPLTSLEISDGYGIPVRLVTDAATALHSIGLINFIESDGELMEHPLTPSMEPRLITVGEVLSRLDSHGAADFIPDFDTRYEAVATVMSSLQTILKSDGAKMPLASLSIPSEPTTLTK